MVSYVKEFHGKKGIAKLIKVCYKNLIDKNYDLSHEIEESFGSDKLGLIVIKNIPNYVETRTKLLKLGLNLALIDESILRKYEKPKSNYNLGWGKARGYTDGIREELTGHFYARINSEKLFYPENKQMEEDYKNIWPEELPALKQCFQNLGMQMMEPQMQLLKHLDKYIESKVMHVYPGKKYNTRLYDQFFNTKNVLGRLIMNYPAYESKQKIFDNWTGWHRDFGILTALTRPMYFNSKLQEVKVNNTGLLVKNIQNNLTEVIYEEDEMIIQAGDVSFIMSGGIIIPTPHAVKIKQGIPRDVYRINYVNFLEPDYSFKINLPFDLNSDQLYKKDPFKLMNVFTNWSENISYKDFITKAIKSYFPTPDDN